MRSELIFGAEALVSNRCQLVKVVSKATRSLHRPGARIQDTMNEVLERLSGANPDAAVKRSRQPPAAPVLHKVPHPDWDVEAPMELHGVISGQVADAAAQTVSL